jgi:hypothetical protein
MSPRLIPMPREPKKFKKKYPKMRKKSPAVNTSIPYNETIDE